MAVTSELVSRRLNLRPFTRDDLAYLHGLWTDPEVRRYLWDDVVIPRRQAEAVIEASLASFGTRGFGFWVVMDAKSGERIGFAGLREFGDGGEIELLYGLQPNRWGEGLATEAAAAVLRFGFERCGLARIHAGSDPPNEASIRVIERLGMRYEGRRVLDGGEAIYYALDAPASRRMAR